MDKPLHPRRKTLPGATWRPAGPSPASGWRNDIQMLQGLDEGLPTGAPAAGCSFGVADYEAFRKPVIAAVEAMRPAGVPVISLDAKICGSLTCRTRVDGTTLYLDAAHLGGAGVALLARRTQLPQLIERMKQ